MHNKKIDEKKKGFKWKKTLLPALGLAFVMATAIVARWETVSWGVPPTQLVEGVAKSEVILDDDDKYTGAARKANVLFLLDTGSTMAFTPTGTLPDKKTSGWTQTKAAAMLKDCTYGSGALPLIGTATYGDDRYGRDLDEDNNVKLDDLGLMTSDPTAFMAKYANDYYFPFNYTGSPLNAFFSSPYPNIAGSNSQPLPYALVLKRTGTTAATLTTTLNQWRGASAPSASTQEQLNALLVPNDSRMYKLKLVMWRLLADPALFENLRFGMATTFQEISGTSILADFYKVGGPGVSNPYGSFNAPINGKSTVPFPNGSGPSWSTGLNDNTNAIGDGYYRSQTARWGVMRNFYDEAKNTFQWVHINRACLRVPMDEYSDNQLALFRMWIDGYENGNSSTTTHYYNVNPELFADGKTYLSTALFPGHPNLDRAKLLDTSYINTDDRQHLTYPGIVFSSKNGRVTATNMYGTAEASGGTWNIFNKGSGEAVGTILDFFSPPVNKIGDVTTSATNVNVAPRENFPLKEPCEKNWVVVFTAGDDSQAGEYSAADAAKMLYEYTRDKKLTKLKSVGATNTFEEIQLEDGVRTLVVGFVDETDPSTKDLRDRLDAMAKAGDPGNPEAKAYFANNVPGLITAMRTVLTRINTEIQPAKGPLTESGALEGESSDGSSNLFSATYRVNNLDQWEGLLSRIETSTDVYGDIVSMTKKWELGANLKARRDANASSRKVVFWYDNAWKTLAYTSSMTDTSAHPYASLMGLNDGNLASVSKVLYKNKLHPSRAMVNWLYGYDFSYEANEKIPRAFVLADTGKSGVVMVQKPSTIYTNLPGYNIWAASSALQARVTRVFTQTNDGILHVIDPKMDGSSGSQLEEKAIVPPPVMQPYRLTTTKFSLESEGGEKKASWIDYGRSSDGMLSKPAYLLDGPLVLRDFDFEFKENGTTWGTYLIGMLGRAGNGFYLMDVTFPDQPKFLWYRETKYQQDGKISLITMEASQNAPTYPVPVAHPGSSLYSSPNDYPFYQMGYNMPRPMAGVAKLPSGAVGYRNMIVMPAGFQENLDLNNNGKVGAALYVVDPQKGFTNTVSNQGTRVFNSGNIESTWRAGSAETGADPHMGMMVSPISLVRSDLNKWITGKIFAADNRGNIFMVTLESGMGRNAVPLAESDWKIKTVATLRASGETAADDNHSIPTGLLLSRLGRNPQLWVSGGTANVGTRGNDHNDSALIRNKGQYIFAFKVPADNESLLRRNDLKQITSGDEASPADKGWYIPLQKAVSGDLEEEYVTTQPVLMSGQLYCATFIPRIPTNLNDACGGKIKGISRLYGLDIVKAGGTWDPQDKSSRYLKIDGIKITGLSHLIEGKRQKLMVSFSVLDSTKATADLNDLASKGYIKLGKGDMANMVFTVETAYRRLSDELAPLGTYIDSWREY